MCVINNSATQELRHRGGMVSSTGSQSFWSCVILSQYDSEFHS